MGKMDFEGSIVLEKLAEIGKVDEFFDAVDSDDFKRAKRLMVNAGVEATEISKVLHEMQENEG